ncbi:zinc finger, RING/FYVE/PHD-type containing protein, partial [Tanacetum coccineum]
VAGGSGKSYLAKLLCDIEVERESPRIHSMDEYFMTKVEKAEDSELSKCSGSLRGKTQVMKKVMSIAMYLIWRRTSVLRVQLWEARHDSTISRKSFQIAVLMVVFINNMWLFLQQVTYAAGLTLEVGSITFMWCMMLIYKSNMACVEFKRGKYLSSLEMYKCHQCKTLCTLRDVRLLYATRLCILDAIVAAHRIVANQKASTRCFPYSPSGVSYMDYELGWILHASNKRRLWVNLASNARTNAEWGCHNARNAMASQHNAEPDVTVPSALSVERARTQDIHKKPTLKTYPRPMKDLEAMTNDEAIEDILQGSSFVCGSKQDLSNRFHMRDPSSFLAFLEFLPGLPGLRWLWRGVVAMRIRILGLENSEPGDTPSVGRQTLKPGGWVVAGEITLLYLSFNALVRVMLGRGPSYFTISSLQLDLKSWKLE